MGYGLSEVDAKGRQQGEAIRIMILTRRVDELLEANNCYLQRARDAALVNARLKEGLKEYVGEAVWNAYHAGIERDGTWWDGGMSDAEWLERELGLKLQERHDQKAIQDAFPALVERLIEAIATGEANVSRAG
jgi:hypothetical protein